MSARLPECSTCSPGAKIFETGVSCQNSTITPAWCSAPTYDPEGALATLGAVLSVWLGLHYGHILKHPGHYFTGHRKAVLFHWVACSGVLILVGCVLEHWEPMNKQLWTTSYALYMAGTCGAALSFFHLFVDCHEEDPAPGDDSRSEAPSACESLWRLVGRFCEVLFEPLRWMGMNAILVFAWHGLATVCIDMLYWDEGVANDGTSINGGSKRQNLTGWLADSVFGGAGDAYAQTGHCAECQLWFVLCKIGCFALGCGYCAKIGYFWKL